METPSPPYIAEIWNDKIGVIWHCKWCGLDMIGEGEMVEHGFICPKCPKELLRAE